jgi:hypothetical protein
MKKIYYLIAMAVTAFTFTSCEDVPEPFGQPINPNAGSAEVIEPKGTGTADDPLNIAAAIAKCKEVGETASTEKYYIKGVSQEEYTVSSYKNIELKIYDTEDSKAAFTIFRCKGAGGVEFEEGQKIAKGSVFIVYGPVVNYKGNTPETSNGAYIVSINGVPTGGGGGGDTPTGETIGTKEAPLTIAQALEKINALEDGKESELNAYVKGKVVKVTTSQANFEKYGNLNYLISEDGTETNAITVYSGDGLDGAKFTGIDALGAGDEVIVFGKLYKYVKDSKVTPEIAKGNYLVSLVKAGSGGSDAAKGTKENPYNVAEALAAINALADNGYSDAEVYVKGTVVKVTTTQANFEKYGNLNYLISADGTESNTITVYSGDGLDGAKFTGIDALGAGDVVIVYGKLQKYVKNDNVTPEIAKGNYLVSLVKAGSGGSDAAKGTKDNPYNIAEALAAINALADNGYSDAEVYVKGKVVKVTTTQANFEKYGNLNYLISEDGTETSTITVYSGDALNGSKFTGIDALKQNDEVIVYGKLQKYVKNSNVTPEIAKGNYLVSLNGKTE